MLNKWLYITHTELEDIAERTYSGTRELACNTCVWYWLQITIEKTWNCTNSTQVSLLP